MNKGQVFEDFVLNEGEKLSDGLARISDSVSKEVNANYVEIIQVIPRNESEFTLVFNAYYKS
ncbi:MAG: hypothetical protein PME_23410 [Priestia megaterium]